MVMNKKIISKKIRVIVLSRCSTIYQDVSQQTEAIMKQVLSDGYSSDEVYFIENNESGSKLSFEEREGLTELFSVLSDDNFSQNVEAVYCFEISRIGRKPDVVFKVRDFLIQKHINLVCIKPYFKMFDETGRISESSSIMFGLFAVMAESETRTRVERTMRGKLKKRSEKCYTGGWVAYGYNVNPETKKFEYNLEQKEIILKVYNEYLAGKSITIICRELMDLGLIWHTRERMAKCWVATILSNELYYNEKVYPAIISEETFLRVKQMRYDKMSRSVVAHKYIYYCAGILADYKTGWILTGNGARECYGQEECHAFININIIDSVIWEISKQHRIQVSTSGKDDILKKLIDDISDLENKIDIATEKITDFRKKQDMIETRLIMGKISETAAENLEADIKSEIKKISEKLTSWNTELSLKNTEYGSFDNRFDNQVAELDSITDDTVRYNIVHEEISLIKLERLSKTEVKLHIKFNYTDKFEIYDLFTGIHHNKLSFSGIEIPFVKYKRFDRYAKQKRTYKNKKKKSDDK